MLSKKDFKKQLYARLQNMLNKKIDAITEAIKTVKESRDNETKSTAGDKYETGRAMMQIEIENQETLLYQTMQLQKELSQISMEKDYAKVEKGSLVFTNQGNYFLSVGIGKVEEVEGNNYAISLVSPIGLALKEKSAGEKILFNEKEFVIEEIV